MQKPGTLTFNSAITYHKHMICELDQFYKTCKTDVVASNVCVHEIELHQEFIEELEEIRKHLIKTINTDSI